MALNLQSQEYLAKLLAKENLAVQHGNYSTASFDVMNRVLRLPLWEDKGKDVYDLLVGHEVGHALYTPVEGWHDSKMKIRHIPRAYLNIVEDIRIERKIQETYPGIVRPFTSGYARLFDDNLFGTDDRDINKSGLMDRLNVHSKGRGYVPVEFSDEEAPLVKEAMEVKTWDDVVKICEKLFAFVDENEEDEMPEGTNPDFPSNDMDGDDEVETENPKGTTPPEDDEEMDEEGEGEGGENDSEGKEKETEEKKFDKHSPWTEENFRENEKDLLEKKEDRYDEAKQSMYSSGISDENLEKVVFSYKDAKAMRIEWCEENPQEENYSAYTNPAVTEDWEKSKAGLNSTANLLAKDFERKKAAFEYSRALTAKTGKLDPLKLHAYKTSEDIFLTTTQLAQAKSHGIMMFMDLSGSMCDIIEDVTNQAISIAMFCRKVHIPFEVYSFTTCGWHGKSLHKDDIEVKGNEIDDLTKIKVVEMFSSKMNNKTFDEAAKEAFGISKAHSYRRDIEYYIPAGQLHSIDAMGSTPLIQTTILAAKLTTEFQKRHAIQKTNVMILTDGYPDSIGINDDEHADVKTHRNHKVINFNGKLITGEGARDLYKNALIRLKEITGAKIFGFHLANDASSFGQGYWDVNEKDYKEFKDVIKKWRKDNFLVWKNQKGYDDYFIIKCGNKPVDDEFEPKKTETIRDIRNEFKKFNKTKKHTKQLVARITDAVAV